MPAIQPVVITVQNKKHGTKHWSHRHSASLFIYIMTLSLPSKPSCACMLAVVGLLRMYFGSLLRDATTEIHLLSSGVAYWHLSKSVTLLSTVFCFPPPLPVGFWLIQLCWKPQNELKVEMSKWGSRETGTKAARGVSCPFCVSKVLTQIPWRGRF